MDYSQCLGLGALNCELLLFLLLGFLAFCMCVLTVQNHHMCAQIQFVSVPFINLAFQGRGLLLGKCRLMVLFVCSVLGIQKKA